MSRRQRHAFISPGSNFSTSVPENAVRSLDEEIGRARKALTGVRGPKSTGQLRTGRAGIQASSKGLLLLEGLQAMEGHLRKSVMELRYSDDDHAEAEKVLCEMVDSNHFRIYRVVGEGMGEVLMYESALQDMSAGLSVSRWGRTCLQVTLLNIGSNSRPAPLSRGSIPISRGMSVTDLSNRTSSLTHHDRIKRAKGRRMSVNVELSVSGTSYGNKVGLQTPPPSTDAFTSRESIYLFGAENVVVEWHEVLKHITPVPVETDPNSKSKSASTPMLKHRAKTMACLV
eukprot:Tamp_10898.p1 GENE.Tamp_10898~~Tamp_10898.p1  ORF type:complete len:285 (+),score=12.00 Tamp_10898:714-1568(+)